LCQRGHDHAVIAPGPRDDVAASSSNASTAPTTSDDARGVFEPGAQTAGRMRVIRIGGPALPYDGTYHLLGRFDKILPLVRAEQPDVLEAHSPYLATAAAVACGRRAARVRTAFWHADHLGAYVEPALTRLFGRRAAEGMTEALWAGVRVVLAPFDATFVAGVAQARRLRDAGVRRVVHVPFGVDAQTFHPGVRSEARRRELTQGDGAAHGALLVGVGRFAIEKRWDVVLDAFARVRERQPAVLILFGDGPERADLERRAPPGVRFAGFETDRSRLAGAIACADALVHGCPCETSGLAITEAVACGVPVVVPDQGGAAEGADERCSETYASLDAEACVAAIERLLARNGPELRARAIEAASRVPTVDEHFARVLSVYSELLAGC
jgi:alpha-1,6-mannosyltransferase